MSHSLPHMTLTTSTSSLSPISCTSPIFPKVSPSQKSRMILNPYIICDGPRQSGGSTQIPSLISATTRITVTKQLRKKSASSQQGTNQGQSSSSSCWKHRSVKTLKNSSHSTGRPGVRLTPAPKFREDPPIEFQTLDNKKTRQTTSSRTYLLNIFC